MIINEVIQRVQSLYSKGVESDDTRLSSRHIYNKLLTVRAKLFQEKADKNKFISPYVYSEINCLELIKVPIHECPCLPPLGCCTLRSKYKFPSILTNRNGLMVKSVTTLDGRIRYSETDFETEHWANSNRYTSSKASYYFANDYLYVTMEDPNNDDDEARVVRVELMLEDPLDAIKYPSYCPSNQDCTSYRDVDFKIESAMVEPLIQLTAQELIQVFNAGQEDSSNNTKDNPEQTTK